MNIYTKKYNTVNYIMNTTKEEQKKALLEIAGNDFLPLD